MDSSTSTFAVLSNYLKSSPSQPIPGFGRPTHKESDGGPQDSSETGPNGGMLESCENEHPVYLVPSDQLCSHFFQQQGAIDYKSYLRLKREERLAILQFNASIKIQAYWRGYLVRSNWKVITAAAIKIQAWIRGWTTRKKYREIIAERDAHIREAKMEAAAIKIQAAWRGYYSRKYRLDFKKYKSIQDKNEALKRSIARINELESALLKTLSGERGSDDLSEQGSRGSLSGPVSRKDSMDSVVQCPEPSTTEAHFSFFLNNVFSPSVEAFLIEKLPEYVDDLNESRIAELYAYMANMEVEIKEQRDIEKLAKKLGGIHNLSPQQLARLEESRRVQRERANGILDLAKLVMIGPLRKKLEEDQIRAEKKANRSGQKDSVDKMFPDMPDRDDLVKPNPAKVEALKDAIRMFRERGEEKEDRNLKKKHVLLRTKACPGVYSDIYTTELTRVEQKLKSMKFWKGSLAKERRERREEMEKEKRLRTMFTRAIKICNMRESPEGDDFEEEEDVMAVEEKERPKSVYDEYYGEMGPEDECGGNSSDEDFYRCGEESSIESLYSQESNPRPPPPTPTAQRGGRPVSPGDEESTFSGRISDA